MGFDCVVIFDWFSDDELTPYDMSGDQEISRASPPRYLRDCLESMAPQIPFIQTSPPLLNVMFLAPTPIFFFIFWPTHPALISSEDPVRVELSLRVAEDLVRKNVFAAREVWQQHTTEILFQTIVFLQKHVVPYLTMAAFFCFFVLQISVQLTKVLLHMENKYSIDGFLSLRQATMVAVTVTDCIPVWSFILVTF